MKKKKFWTSDKLVSLAAMFVSLITLFIFIKQTNIIDTQNHLSVMPYLMVESSNNSEAYTYRIDLENYGVGPAIIEERVIYYEGKEYRMEFEPFLRATIPEMDSVVVINQSTIQTGLALPAGGRRNIITVGGGKKSYETFLRIITKMQTKDLNYKIEYKSIYNDRWEINSESDVPQEL
ncbi:MAG: hypothetical protein AAF489_01855 [Bacteroidota bacterium]